MDLKTNDRVDLKLKNDRIIIIKLKNMLLEEHFLKYNGENLTKKFSWDEPKGYRPAIVISNNVFNQNTKMIAVCSITSSNR